MSEEENRRAVERMIQAINQRRPDLMDEQFHEDSVIEYPQSGERIVGGENRRAVYGNFPSLPTLTVRRMRVSGSMVVAEVDYAGKDENHLTVIICELRDGKIVRETGYWAKPFEPAAWRAQWVERS